MKTDTEIKELWFKFFEKHGFKRIENASIIPENDPSVLFTTAGMHPLVPYLLGEKHPQGNRLCNVQRCIRTGDIDEVGDAGHLTCFEMLGNWFLGDCPKEDMIKLSFEFLTSKEYLGIPKERLAASVFAGDETAPRDEVAYNAWKNCGVENVFYLPKEHNWWGLGGGVAAQTQRCFMTQESQSAAKIVLQRAIVENILKFGMMFSCNTELIRLAKRLPL